MVLFAPISGRLINLYGGRITLVTGAALMGTAYLVRVFFSSTALVVIALSMLVAVGTAITYAAMPTLIMASVPITETASANGLNSLLRAIGTSTSSAAVTAVLASVTVQIGSAIVPSFRAFQEIYWMTGVSALTAGAVAWYLPARRRAGPLAVAGARELPPSVTEAGENNEIVVRGSILQFEKRPVHPAVITVMKTDGTPVDWSRADSNGDFSVVLPGPGRYLLLANAQGWTPRAEVVEFRDANTRQHITLTDQLTLSGTISRGGTPIGGALVTLSEAAGEVVGSVRADDAGRYCMPLPGAGRYIVTMLEPDERHAYARKVVLDVRSAVVDVEAPALAERL